MSETSSDISNHEEKEIKKWEWLPCIYDFKQTTDGKEIVWNFSPYVMLSSGDSNVSIYCSNFQEEDPDINIVIEMEKTFKYDPRVGWNWHKSWNLPTISIILSVIDNETIQEILCPSNLYVEIFAVKAIFNNLENFHLQDVGLTGLTRTEIIDGVGSFTSQKFSTTSYINEGVKFHLVICLMFKQEDSGNPKILFSRISPPIFIDSRRSARGAQKQRVS